LPLHANNRLIASSPEQIQVTRKINDDQHQVFLPKTDHEARFPNNDY